MSSNLQSTPRGPIAAASAAIFRAQEVLLVQRSTGENNGLWSFPGGRIELGETACTAAARETREETGIEAKIISLVDVHDVIYFNDTGDLRTHYVLSVFCGLWISGEPAAASDARTARFVRLNDLKNYTLTPGLTDYAERAFKIVCRAITP